MKYSYSYQTPVGQITVSATQDAVTAIQFGENLEGSIRETELIKKTFQQLDEYFKRSRTVFDIPLLFEGTEFQKKVWSALQQIPYGRTVSYKELAIVVGNEKACRAVGMANNRNKIAIIVPCHRVIGSNGKLVGYAAGLEVKNFLLNLEKL